VAKEYDAEQIVNQFEFIDKSLFRVKKG